MTATRETWTFRLLLAAVVAGMVLAARRVVRRHETKTKEGPR